MALSVKKVETLVKKPGRYFDEHGLYLQVIGASSTWVFRYERNGHERWMGIGPVHTFTLAEARERARGIRQQIKDNIDPLAAREADRKARMLQEAKRMTFKECAEAFHAFHGEKWKNHKHRAQFKSTLTEYAYPTIGNLSVADIDTGLVLKCIEPIWKSKTETANRVRQRIEKVLSWATVRGYRTGDNPARWKDHLDHILPARSQIAKPEHHAALPYSQVADFISMLRERPGLSARALEATILSACRTKEVIGMRWDEIDLVKKLWVIPAARMKADREHRVPLSSALVQILNDLPKTSDLVFGRMSNMAMNQLLKRMGYGGVITVHGFRSSFRDWASETTSHQHEVIEMALAHIIKNKTEAAYRRGDLLEKRVKLLADWAQYCATTRDENVTPIRRVTK
jgi:integrase